MSTPRHYFDRMYRVTDPWSFETSDYEQAKYRRTVAALPRPSYRRAFEPGCSIGVLSEQLAPRCDELLSVDHHPVPLAQARRRLADLAHVEVRSMEVPRDWPDGTFDLIVVSEIAYYFDDDALGLLIERVGQSLEPGGDLVLVHWRGATDYPQRGDDVHERWAATPGLEHLSARVEQRYRLDVLRADEAR